MDIVHSHAVKNEAEGLGRLDGSYDLYFTVTGAVNTLLGTRCASITARMR